MKTHLTLGLLLALAQPLSAQVVVSEWNTGSGAWNIAGNWAPNQVPDNGDGNGPTYDVQIGNRPVAVGAYIDLVPRDGTSDTISSLTVSGGADLDTNGNSLIVLGQTTISGTGSSIAVKPAAGGGFALNTDNLDLNGGALQMSGGMADIDVLLEVNAGSTITGHGLVVVGNANLFSEIGLENSGSIIVGNTSTPVLTLRSNGVDTLDLDGTTELGIVDVANVNANTGFDTLTLVVDGPLSDAFGGVLSVGQRDRVTFNDSFTMDGAEVDLDGGNQVATMDGAGAVTSIANSTFDITGGALIGNNLTFTGSTNSVTINAASTLTLGGSVTMPPLTLNFVSSTAALGITGAFSSVGATDDFNWDGPGTASTTISGTGNMNLNVDHVDTGNDIYGGTLNLNDDGDLTVNVTASLWTMAGTLNKNNAGTSTVNGDRIVVTGNVNVNAGTLDLPATTLSSGSDVAVAGLLTLGGASELAGPTTLTGAGTLRMEGASTVTASTTIGVDTFDYDGLASGSLHTINDGAVLTINSAVLDSDGDMDDPISLGGNGAQLLVNGPAEWTLNGVLNANAAAAGTATLGGTSQMVLANTVNVDGNTNFSAPTTFGAGSTVSIDTAMTLNATNTANYAGVTISGLGSYDAGTVNTVTANSTINPSNFNFDTGNWIVQDNALLTINVVDYDPDAATNAFDATLTLNSSDISVTTSDAEFVLDGTLNMNSSADGLVTIWSGEPIDIGNDAGLLDADVLVTGKHPSQFTAQVDFNSDADVEVVAGAGLSFTGIADFNTVNGANNAEFTGSGELSFGNTVNVNEAVTLNMVGGVVDLDGSDTVGDVINISAPLVINAASMSSFGRVNGGGGINTLDINNTVGTGTLSVNLDNPEAEWTLNTAGVMNLVNDNTEATLLDGNDVNLNGTVNVTGDVRTKARLDLGGTLNIHTVGEPFRLSGGTLSDPNTLAGGTVNGPGLFGADTDTSLRGTGTINANVDFDDNADLRAENGTLNVNGAILDARFVGTSNTVGVLIVVNAWNSNTVFGISLAGGELRGDTITHEAASGLTGDGLVSAKIINNSFLTASTNGSPLLLQTAANDNDWDGTTETGQLNAIAGGVLELRDDSGFAFDGTVSANTGGTVFANGFELSMGTGSSLSLTSGTFKQSNGITTALNGTVSVGVGTSKLLGATTGGFRFNNGCATTLTGTLQLDCPTTTVQPTATFAGAGTLTNLATRRLVPDNLANVNVLVENRGTLAPGNNAVARNDVRDFIQTATGSLELNLNGTALSTFDRLQVNGSAQLAGTLRVTLGGGYVPAIGDSIIVLTTAGSRSGTFGPLVQPAGMPAGRLFHVIYNSNNVELKVVSSYDAWINSFTSLTNPADRAKAANPDGDSLNNLGEFALDGDPTSGRSSGKVVGKIATVGGVKVFTLTLPVRTGAILDPADPAGGELVLKQTADVLSYRIQAADNLTSFPHTVTEVTGSDAVAVQFGLPALNSGWTYRSFRSPGPVSGDPAEFMRVVISE